MIRSWSAFSVGEFSTLVSCGGGGGGGGGGIRAVTLGHKILVSV